MTILLPLAFALIGLFLYFTVGNPKWQEIGRITFFCGLFAFLMHVGAVSLNLLK